MELKYITKVYIIESPSQDDLNKGLEEGKALADSFHKAGIKHGYYAVDCEKSLKDALAHIAADVAIQRKTLGAVTVHMSMHGNTDGIGLTSDEFVSWENLAIMLREFMHSIKPIVSKAGNQLSPLTICFSSCEGLNAAKVNDYAAEDESLFQFVVGPVTPVTWAQSESAFTAFHQHTLDGGGNALEAIKKMNYAAGLDNIFHGRLGKWLEWCIH